MVLLRLVKLRAPLDRSKAGIKIRRCRRGLSLVEVVVSIALLSTLMVSLLSIRSSHVRQIRLAAQKRHAVELLDRQLAQWFDSETLVPVDQQGQFDGEDQLSWRTGLVSRGDFNGLKVRVEAFESASGDVVSYVEVVVPDSRAR